LPPRDPWLRKQLRPALQGATFLGVAMIALTWASIGFDLRLEWKSAQQAAIQNSGNLARAFEEQIIRSIREVDKALLVLRDAYERDPRHFNLDNSARYYLGEAIPIFGVIDQHGMLRATTPSRLQSPVDLSDREHFRLPANATDDELFIGRPVAARTTGQSAIFLARRIRNADGSFGGVLTGSLDPNHFVRFYESIDLGQRGAIALIGLDGVIRAARGLTFDPGRSLSGTGLFARMGRPEGWFVDKAILDGTPRLVSYRRVKGYPLIVAVGLALDEIFADYERDRRWYFVVGSALTLLVLIAIALSIRHRMKLEDAREALHVSEASAQEKSRELQVTLDNMSQGIIMIDPSHEVAVINRQTINLLDLPPRFLDTRPKIEEILSYLWDKGEFGKGGEALDPYIREFIKSGAVARDIVNYERTRPNGTVIQVHSAPLAGGGIVRTFTDVTDYKRAEARVAYMAHHDALTDLPNRVLLREQMTQAVARLQGKGEGFALLALDLDHFKEINDTLGHPVGDELLQEVSRRLRCCVRDADTVARLGGDEFAILSPETRSAEDAGKLAERLVAAIIAPYRLCGEEALIGSSIGIALAPNDGTTADELFKHADLALYNAKAEGGNIYRCFERGMDAQLQSRRSLELALHNALRSGEFELHYQPLIDLRSNGIAGFEALLRWRRPGHGLMSSNDFVPFAEEAGLIVPIGEWALRRACADAVSWPRDIKVAVNLSAIQFKKSNVTGIVVNALAESGLAPQRLELEITETILLGESAENLSTLRQLRSLGAAVVLDDFGTGYSSLSYLHAFPFDKIKIDKSFVTQLFTRPNCLAIVRALAALGTSLGMTVTGEGVETREQLDELKKAGCTEAQGNLFSVPRPSVEIGAMIAEQVKRPQRVA
jgi:diguanylate cyclase (GGDEF)-like protein